MVQEAQEADLPKILEIYAAARDFMRRNGNPSQWGESYPPESVLRDDILHRQLYTVKDEDETITGVFAFIIGNDPTYEKIDGAWLSSDEYGTIHRVASSGKKPGVFSSVLSFCESKIRHLRIDTHEQNLVMQHLIAKHGFVKCGTIYTHDVLPPYPALPWTKLDNEVYDGTPRIAYEKM